MKIVYIANAKFPTGKAHGIQIIKMCEAFVNSSKDINLELVVTKNKTVANQNLFDYYKIKEKFKVTYVPSIDLSEFGKLGVLIQQYSFLFFTTVLAFFKSADIIYTRGNFFISLFNKNSILEVHAYKKRNFSKFLYNRFKKIIVITEKLKELYIQKGVLEEKIFVSPDGVDLNQFDIGHSKEEARREIGIPLDKKIVVYTGHLYKWKGADVLAQAVKVLSDDTVVYFVGGLEKIRQDFINKYKNLVDNGKIVSIEHQDNSKIPVWLKAADVLVLPNIAKDDMSKFYTSPLKLFEYMAAKRPIVAADLPSLRDILNKSNSILFTPDDSKDLAEKIKLVFNDRKKSENIAEQAFLEVGNYTWEKRVENILTFINEAK